MRGCYCDHTTASSFFYQCSDTDVVPNASDHGVCQDGFQGLPSNEGEGWKLYFARFENSESCSGDLVEGGSYFPMSTAPGSACLPNQKDSVSDQHCDPVTGRFKQKLWTSTTCSGNFTWMEADGCYCDGDTSIILRCFPPDAATPSGPPSDLGGATCMGPEKKPCIELQRSEVIKLNALGYNPISCQKKRLQRRLRGLDPGPPCPNERKNYRATRYNNFKDRVARLQKKPTTDTTLV